MHNINDSIHQLFSTLLSLSRECEPISFESKPYQTGSGFRLQTESGENQYHLIESIGLLGFSHPLKIKSSLMAALGAQAYSEKEDTLDLISKLESFFSNLVGFDLYINASTETDKYSTAPGRYANFFSDLDLEILKKQSLNVNYILPFSFSLSRTQKNSHRQNFMTDQSIYTSAVLRLLSDGQFYSGAKLIAKRSEQILNKLSPIPFISSVSGLTIKVSKKFDLNKLRSRNIFCNDHLLILPLFFNESDLDFIISVLQEEFKCL